MRADSYTAAAIDALFATKRTQDLGLFGDKTALANAQASITSQGLLIATNQSAITAAQNSIVANNNATNGTLTSHTNSIAALQAADNATNGTLTSHTNSIAALQAAIPVILRQKQGVLVGSAPIAGSKLVVIMDRGWGTTSAFGELQSTWDSTGLRGWQYAHMSIDGDHLVGKTAVHSDTRALIGKASFFVRSETGALVANTGMTYSTVVLAWT